MTIRERNTAELKRKWKQFLKRQAEKSAEQRKQREVREDN